MFEMECDVAIIGAGSAGRAAYGAATAAGARAIMIESGPGGTLCAQTGCMPSKLLIAAAAAAYGVRTASVFGINAGLPEIDGRAVLARVRQERDYFVHAVHAKDASIPPDRILKGRARFLEPNVLGVGDVYRVSAKCVVIATGSRSSVPKMFEGVRDRVVTTDTIFELDDLPRSLAVIGAGPVGIELAQAFSRLGVVVAVFDKGISIGGLHDSKVSAKAADLIGRDVPLHLGIEPTVAPYDGGVELTWYSNGEDHRASFDKVLVAAGRPPDFEKLDLHRAGLACDERGVPHFDQATMRCGDSSIYLAGDADASKPFTHEAMLEGEIAGRNAALFPDISPSTRKTPLAIVFTAPNLASVGLSGSSLDRVAHVVGSASFDDQGRARIDNVLGGMLHVYANPRDGRLLGAEMVGPGVEHLAHLLAFGIQQGLTAEQMLELPFYHPTLEEGLETALKDLCHKMN
jgi:dihydrolipoamide dehydrogenase